MFGIEGSNRTSGNYTISWKPQPPSKFEVNYDTDPNFADSALFVETTGSVSGVKNLFVTTSYKENNFAASFYNKNILTDTSGRLGGLPMDKMVFGANGFNANPQLSFMHLKRFSYWPLQLQNNRLTGIYRY
jgi:hypothetical protein